MKERIINILLFISHHKLINEKEIKQLKNTKFLQNLIEREWKKKKQSRNFT